MITKIFILPHLQSPSPNSQAVKGGNGFYARKDRKEESDLTEKGGLEQRLIEGSRFLAGIE